MDMNNPEYTRATSVHEFKARNIKGTIVRLALYKGHVSIIVNVASDCKLAPTNYKQLNDLYEQYGESKGLRILAFPCNQFNGLEPGDSQEIASFAADNNVKFDMFEKIDVNGENAHPLWKFLKHKLGGARGGFVKYNFEKFIINKEGKPMERHATNVYPIDLVKSLENYW